MFRKLQFVQLVSSMLSFCAAVCPMGEFYVVSAAVCPVGEFHVVSAAVCSLGEFHVVSAAVCSLGVKFFSNNKIAFNQCYFTIFIL